MFSNNSSVNWDGTAKLLASELKDDSQLSVFHLNIRSFNRNSDELSAFLSQLPTKPSIIVLSETWFSVDTVTDLSGYEGHHVMRSLRRGGGVSVFIRSDITWKPCDGLCYIGDYMEICTVRVSLPRSNLSILGIYRPPDRDARLFAEEIGEILSRFRLGDRVLIVGDINIDLLNPNGVENDFIDICNSNSFLPLINDVTHVTRFSSSCIDHMWYNYFDVISSGAIELDITDHFAIFVVFDSVTDNREFTTKQFRDHGPDSLRMCGDQVRFLGENFCVSNGDDVDAGISGFVGEFYKVYDRCCPVRTKRLSVNRLQKPWFTTELIRCINRKHSLFREYKMGLTSFVMYNKFKNMTTSLIRRAKSKYYVSKFKSLKGDSGGTWKLFNSISGKKNTNRAVDQLFYHNQTITDSQSIADAFNNFFSSIGSDLDRNIPIVPKSPLDYMGDSALASFFVQPASPGEVSRLIMGLPVKSCGLKSVPTFIYKHCSAYISSVISDLFNISVAVGEFPECLKTARIVPIHKAGDRSSVNNYRPISILTTLSKIFEKLMLKRFLCFVKENNILNSNQFGFRSKSCTSDAILEFLDFTFESLSSSNALLSVFLDFSKAFDTVNHDILLSKLFHLGVRGVAHRWFESYLRARKQYVVVGSSASAMSEINIGVPQGSVLGPVLFLIYINDMRECSTNLRYVHFADDTTAFHSHSDLQQLTSDVNADLGSLCTWLRCNRLSLNVNKTVYMMFTNRKMLVPPVITIAGTGIQQVEKSKFLGVTLDNKLTFAPHVDIICKQVAKSIGMLNRLAPLLPPSTKTNIYYSLIYSKVSYGVVAWGSGILSHVRRLENLILKAQGIIRHGNHMYHDNPTVGLLTFSSIYKYFVALKTFKTLKGGNHAHFVNSFDSLLPVHSHSTRFSSNFNFNTPFYLKAKCNRSFLYQAVLIWNSLPERMKQCNDLLAFKKVLKTWLLAGQS